MGLLSKCNIERSLPFGLSGHASLEPHLGDDLMTSGYVRKYFDVKNRAFLPNFMRDFDHLYAKLLSGYQSRNNRCENRAFY